MPAHSFPAPGVLIPTSLAPDGSVSNGYIALGNSRIGGLEYLKKQPGVARVCCKERGACDGPHI